MKFAPWRVACRGERQGGWKDESPDGTSREWTAHGSSEVGVLQGNTEIVHQLHQQTCSKIDRNSADTGSSYNVCQCKVAKLCQLGLHY